MIHVFFEGIAWGLLVAISIGPAFFTIIQTGIDRGFKAAFYISLGVLMCDTFLITICYLGLTSIFDSKNSSYLGLTGGIIIIIFGIYSYFKKPEIIRRRSAKYKTPPKQTKHIKYFIKGFFLNIANPFIYFFWLAAIVRATDIAIAEKGIVINYVIVFFSGVLSTVFGTDLLKSFIGNKIKKYLRPRVQLWIKRIIGVLLIVLGIILIVRVLL
ncbi:MAG: LysE family transporter [Bacteroidetes bacterium]|nr:LysE family transporter [Bacteroidota bacterium]